MEPQALNGHKKTRSLALVMLFSCKVALIALLGGASGGTGARPSHFNGGFAHLKTIKSILLIEKSKKGVRITVIAVGQLSRLFDLGRYAATAGKPAPE